MPEFPQLPIITPDPPRLTAREKYGNLFYLGILGLVISILVVVQFGVGFYLTRHLWSAFYSLNDSRKPEADRIKAAWLIAHSDSANDVQRLDSAFQRSLPPLARYILAEGLTSDAIRVDPKAYALMTAKSEGWPDWLRLMVARPLAYGAGEGYQIPWEPLEELRKSTDPALSLLATYTRAVMTPGDPPSARTLESEASKPGPFQPFAEMLSISLKLEGEARTRKLDEATRWLRSHHPQARELWNGWVDENGVLKQQPPGQAH